MFCLLFYFLDVNNQAAILYMTVSSHNAVIMVCRKLLCSGLIIHMQLNCSQKADMLSLRF